MSARRKSDGVQPVRLRRYECSSCGKSTVKCRRFPQCRGAAKSTGLWDDLLCSNCLEDIGKQLPGTKGGAWLPRALDTLSPEKAAEFWKDQRNKISNSIAQVEEDISSRLELIAGKVREGSKEGSAHGSAQVEETNRMQEDWEVVRDAVLSWEGPERAAVDSWRELLCRRGFVIRWLKSSRGDVLATTQRLLRHMLWREKYKMHEIHHETWDVHDARRELYVSGVDRQGRATMTWKLGLHDPKNHTPEEFVRYLVLSMERTWAVSPLADHMNVILDCEGLQLSCYDHATCNLAIEVLSENFPDNLQVVIVFPVTWVLTALVSIVSPLLHKDTVAKGKLLQKHEIEAGMRDVFDLDQIEQRLGGGLDVTTASQRRIAEGDNEMIKMLEEEKAQARKNVVASSRVRTLQRELGMGGLEEEGRDKDIQQKEGSGQGRNNLSRQSKDTRGNRLPGKIGAPVSGTLARLYRNTFGSLSWPLYGAMIVAVGAAGAVVFMNRLPASAA